MIALLRNAVTSLSFLRNRYAVAFGSMAILAGVWNLYVALNDEGIIAGQVVGPDRRPVAGATVVVSEKTLLVAAERARTITNGDGKFRFSGLRLYHLYLEASKKGVGRMPAKEFRLYFKGENLFLREPLRLEKSQG